MMLNDYILFNVQDLSGRVESHKDNELVCLHKRDIYFYGLTAEEKLKKSLSARLPLVITFLMVVALTLLSHPDHQK